MLNMQNIIDESFLFAKIIFPKIILAIIIFVLGWWLSKVFCKYIRRIMLKANVDPGAVSFIYSLLIIIFRIIVIITVIAQLGVNMASVITTLGAAGVTAGLALKGSLSNLASGLLILINKPFRVGDYLGFQDVEGTVSKIEMMFTTLTAHDNKAIIIPNSNLTNNSVINYTKEKTRRLDLDYFVSYDSNLDRVKEILNNLFKSNSKVLDKPEPFIAVANHNSDGIQIAVKLWCKSEDYWDLYYEMQEKVKLAFDSNYIYTPFNKDYLDTKD